MNEAPLGERHHVLFLVWQYHPIPAGGAEHQAQLQAEELVRRGHKVTVVTRQVQGVGSGVINGVNVRRLPSIDRHPFRTLTYLCALSLYLIWSLRRFQLVHVHLVGVYTDVVVLLSSLFRTPVYLKIAAGGESGEVRKLKSYARVTRLYGLRHAACIQALSDEIAEELRSVGIQEQRIVRIPNGVQIAETRRTTEATTQARRELDLPLGSTVVLYLGRFSRYKGVTDLMEAWTALTPADAVLVLVGFRPENPPEEQLEFANPPPTVVVREWTSTPGAYLVAADVFVLPSHSEGMSNALLEAMAGGLAVVATRVGAAATLIEHGMTGLIVEPGHPEELASSISELLKDEGYRQRLGAAASVSIRQSYSITAVVTRIEEAYASILSPRGTQGH